MQNFFEFFRTGAFNKEKPWLILGKGPTFNSRKDYNLNQYYTIGLNHVCREQDVTLTHIIDYDVLVSCNESIDQNAKFLLMPWIPHTNNRPGTQTLSELVKKNPSLRRLEQQNRLLWYRLSTAPTALDDSPVVTVKYFSAEAVLNLLSIAGVRKVRSLGIDGGTSYSQEFADLRNKTLLVNGRSSFDRQFEEIAKIILATGIDYAPLDIESPIRIYVGATEAQMLAVKVLEYSIRKHASMSVELVPLHMAGIEIPLPNDPKNQPRTPFSFQRFLIPALRDYRGRAIYLDSDMQVFQDIRSLWVLPLDGANLLTAGEPTESGRRPQFSVMLLNCDALKWDIGLIVQALDDGQLSYSQLVYDMAMVNNIRATLDPVWNSLERYDEGKTALVHYTDMPTQPWVSTENPLGYLWIRDLLEAIDKGFIPIEFIKDQVAKGYVRPSLLYQVENCIEDGLLLPRHAYFLDKNFAPPFEGIDKARMHSWRRPFMIARAQARNYYCKSVWHRLERRFRDRFFR
jgi:hypothetical protein